MKRAVFMLAALIFAFAAGWEAKPDIVHAQISSPSYSCFDGNDLYVSPCVQYVIEFSPARLGGGAWIYQMQTPFDLNGNTNAQIVASGSTASVQALQPNSQTNTITVSIDKP